MSKPASVGGCTSCGALFTHTPGDGGLCPECTQTPASGLALDTDDNELPAPPPLKPLGAIRQRSAAPPAPLRRGGRGLRRILIGTIGASLISGVAVLAVRTEAAPGAWVAVRHHLSDAMATLGRHASPAFARVEAHASQAMVAIRRHTPWPAPQPEPASSLVSSRNVKAGARGTPHPAKVATKR